ncbi:uncharacterized protein LOC124868997 isoform X2 [Girardinichthys multiradiatus]|uniref:uncharacterized protein LOC124868997 isoform X2 n=1 Tax=Girardinichthys multiradiatus TaxID=208333 RepID=UPI001FACE542|nr:uncharacterized protein LOC124868997 isoform X2 [Girardinichthys multiradiatus]
MDLSFEVEDFSPPFEGDFFLKPSGPEPYQFEPLAQRAQSRCYRGSGGQNGSSFWVLVNMQRFWWPGYEMQLLEQLQRQQNSAQFCDTLLQTEGISVPTHSCVLAALSPYLSQSLSATPSPPLGQMRRLHLQAVTAQTLLKLVGLLYSGELEVKSCEEQNDMLAAAHRFGISDLALGCGDEGRKGEELLERRERVRTEEGTQLHKSVKMQDAQVQAEMSGRTDDDPHVKGKSFVSIGTQTVNSSLMSAASPGHLCGQATPPALQCVSSVATVSTSLQPENITQFSFASYPTIHSDPESTAGQSSDCLIYPSFPSASSRYIETLPTSLKADARSPRSHKKNNCKQSPKSGESVSDQHRSGQEDGNANVDGGTSAQLRGVCRERILGGEKEKRNSHFIGRGKNLEKMKQTEQVMKTAQIPFKVKLKRRAKGELWKIVGLQDADEMVSVLTTMKRSCCSQKTHSAHSVLPAHNPEFQTVQPVFTSSPQPLHHASLSSDSEARSNSCFSMNQSHELESESLSPPPGPVEESDEQIDKLLEDIMMSLNILPDLDKNCKKKQANYDGVPTFCQGPAAEDGAGVTPLHADVSAAGFYQDLETHGGHSTTDTGIHCCSGAQNQASYTDPPTGRTDLQTQPSESSSSIRSCGPINGLSCPGEENSSYPQTTGSILPVKCCSSGEKLQYFVLQQQDQNIEFLSVSHESETQPADAFSLHCVDNLRLPQCLSPLEPCPSAAHQQPDPSVSVQPENSIQPSVKTRPWLTEAACTLQFPFNAITAGKNASRPPETSSGCGAEPSQRRRKLKAKSDGNAGFVKNVEVREQKSKLGRKSDRIKRKKNKYEAAEDAAPSKRRRQPDSRKEPEGLPLDSISSERGDPATTVCSVSLSCNNVPIKESGKTIGSLNKPHTATGTETSKGVANLGTEQTRIRTRGFMKRSQQNTSNTISDKCCLLIPVISRAVVAQKQDPALPKRKRGRPPKIKLEQNLPEGVCANAEIKGCKAGEKISEKETPKEERKKGRKFMVNASEEETGQLQKTTSPERPGKNETNNIKSSETQKQSWKVTLKEFQKLIKCKDFKTRKATEVEDGNDSVDIEELEKVREAADEADTEAEMRQVLCDSTFDEKHNLLLDTSAAQWKPTQQGVTGSSETRRSSVSGHGKKPASCPDVLEEEMVMLSSNREQGADQSNTLTGCDGEEEEDEDELDVMLCSPDKGSSTRELGERVVVIPDDDEEEEEDVNEIDVTGDERE